MPSPRNRERRPGELVVAQFPHRSALNPALEAFARGVEEIGIRMIPHTILPGNPDKFGRWVRDHLSQLDILHLHWFQRLYLRPSRFRTLVAIRSMLRALRVARSAGIAVTWTVHNLLPHERPYPRLDLLAHRLIADLVDRAYVETAEAVPAAVTAYPCLRGRISIVPLGSYTSLYPSGATMRDARKRFGLPTDATVWLAFGLIRRYKQIPELITTFAETFGADPNRILLVAGEPHNAVERARIEHAAAGVRNVILRLNRVPEQDVATLLAAANYVVCNYRGSFNSGVALLAASFGRAVLAPPQGNTRDMPPGAIIPIHPILTGTRDALLASTAASWRQAGEAARTWSRQRTWGLTAATIAYTWRELAPQCRVSPPAEALDTIAL